MEYLESLFDRALDAVVGMGADGRVTAWNMAAEEIFGWSRREAMGVSMGDLIVPPQHRHAHARGLDHYNCTGDGPVLEQRIRITAMHRDGTEFPVELSIFPMSQPGRASMFYAFIRSLVAEETFHREQILRASEAETIMAIGQKLIEDVTLEEFTHFCLDQVCNIAGLDAAHLFVMRGNGSDQVLVPSGIWHLKDERFRPMVEETANIQFRLGEGLPGYAWLTGQLETLNSLSDNERFLRRKVFAEVGFTCAVALPVHHTGAPHAVLEFFGTETSRLDPEILRMLKTVGSQIGAAIRRKEGAENREMLRREMVHRVGNSLTVLSSIYRSCSRRAKSKEDLDEAFLGRVVAMGQANRMAIIEAEIGVALPDLILNSLDILPDISDVDLEAPPITVCSEAVLPLSLVLSELATNALKYGGLISESKLHIRADSCKSTDELTIEWRELRNEPLDEPRSPPIRAGFGTQLMQAMIEDRLGGSFERRLDETGFHFIMKLPLRQLKASFAKLPL